MNEQSIIFKNFTPQYAEETVAMWRKSKERAIGQEEIHSFENQVAFLNEALSQQYQVTLAFMDERVVGMAAYSQEEISQLYVHPDCQGMGIGQAFLEKIKSQSNGRLTLYTFQVNEKAQRFYEKHGFKIIGKDYENEENLPDIQYEWTAKGSG